MYREFIIEMADSPKDHDIFKTNPPEKCEEDG